MNFVLLQKIKEELDNEVRRYYKKQLEDPKITFTARVIEPSKRGMPICGEVIFFNSTTARTSHVSYEYKEPRGNSPYWYMTRDWND